MRILLINPPAADGISMVREGRCMQREGAWTAVWAPISLATIAAVLIKAEHQVKLVDCIVEKIDFSALAKIVSAFNPSLAVVNTVTGSIKSDLATAAEIKKVSPKSKVAAFGIHVSALPEASFRLEPKLDFIIRGEPEITCKDLAEVLVKKGEIKEIQGLSFRLNGKIINNPDRPPLVDLDKLPPPAWELVNIKLYRLPFSAKPFLLVGLGRGCPFACCFCVDKTFYGRRLRLPSVKKAVDEIQRNVEEFGVNEFLFWTESFTINNAFASNICREIIKRQLAIRFVVNSRVDQVNPKLLSLLKQAGCWMIGFGIESGDDGILKVMNKGITVSQIKRAVAMARKADLEVTGHLILGFPGETPKTIGKTIQLAIDLDLDFAQFYTSVPFPGSDLYLLAKNKGYLNSDDWSFYEQNFSVMDLPGLPAKKVEALRSEAYRRFYLRPKMIIRTLARIKTLGQLVNFIFMTIKFLGWF